MSAEPRRITKSEVWAEWESQVVNGVFPLRRLLGGSNHSAVFLTEYKAKNLADVAIKFVPADTALAESQLVQWGAAATLSHPHLVRLFDVGRCQFDGRGFLYAVMEYAEQNLAQILPQRALNPDEVREMLVPTLDALAFLHRNHMVHGQLKPANLLVVNDQLKLASDAVRPTGNAPSGIARASSYDPPELKQGVISTAGDIWGLGMTLVEALTQRAPAWPDERGETAALLASLPAPFAETVRRCLSLNPANRPTVVELETQYRHAPRAHVAPAPPPAAPEAPRAATPARNSSRKYQLPATIGAAVLISLAVWVSLRHFTSVPSQADSQPPAVPESAVPETVAPSAVANAAESNPEVASPVSGPSEQAAAAPPQANSLGVLHEVMPDVPRAIGDKIRGHVKVTVRVLVDPTGNVVGQLVESRGPSRYFARVAGDAAADWKFAPDTRDSRVWLSHFEFTRGGVTVHTTAAQ